MTIIPFDTLAYAKKLRLSGISEEQAEAMTEAMSQVLEAKDIATKQDIKALESATKQEIKVSISELKAEIIKWVVGIMVTQTGIMIGAIIASFKFFL